MGDTVTEEQVKMMVDLIGTKLNAHIEKHLAHGKKFLCGDSVTIGDFKVGSWYYGITMNDCKKHPMLTDALRADLDNFPHTKAYLARFGEEMKEYLASRPVSPF